MIAFQAWKAYVALTKRKRGAKQLKELHRRHSVMNNRSDRVLLDSPTPDIVRVPSKKRVTKGFAKLRLFGPRGGPKKAPSRDDSKHSSSHKMLFKRSNSKGFYIPAELETDSEEE